VKLAIRGIMSEITNMDRTIGEKIDIVEKYKSEI
jgi:hypothetical protein